MDTTFLTDTVTELQTQMQNELDDLKTQMQDKLKEIEDKYAKKLDEIKALQSDIVYVPIELPGATTEFVDGVLDDVNNTITLAQKEAETWLKLQQQKVQDWAKKREEKIRGKIQERIEKKKKLIEEQAQQELANVAAVTTGKKPKLPTVTDDEEKKEIKTEEVVYTDNDYLYSYIDLAGKRKYLTGALVATRKNYSPVKVYKSSSEDLARCGILRTKREISLAEELKQKAKAKADEMAREIKNNFENII